MDDTSGVVVLRKFLHVSSSLVLVLLLATISGTGTVSKHLGLGLLLLLSNMSVFFWELILCTPGDHRLHPVISLLILSWRLNLLSLYWLSHLLRAAQLLGHLLVLLLRLSKLLLHLLHLLHKLGASLHHRNRVVLILLLRGLFHDPLLESLITTGVTARGHWLSSSCAYNLGVRERRVFVDVDGRPEVAALRLGLANSISLFISFSERLLGCSFRSF